MLPIVAYLRLWWMHVDSQVLCCAEIWIVCGNLLIHVAKSKRPWCFSALCFPPWQRNTRRTSRGLVVSPTRWSWSVPTDRRGASDSWRMVRTRACMPCVVFWRGRRRWIITFLAGRDHTKLMSADIPQTFPIFRNFFDRSSPTVSWTFFWTSPYSFLSHQ